MTERERQIVYPLLVFALLMGLKGNFQPRLSFEARSIECAELKVSMINGKAVTDSRLPIIVPPPAKNTEATKDEKKSDEAPGDEAPGDEATGDEATGDEATGDEATTVNPDAEAPHATDETQATEAPGELDGNAEGNQETSELESTESDAGESAEVVDP
ncbi:MAG: hypothetical protein CMJ77_23770 [Planctomycetaceae bacterium]|nr:hypothetical protein [Planctomycetaceae bacterium]